MTSMQTNGAAIRVWAQLLRTHKVMLDKTEKALKSNGFPPLIWYDVLLELDRAGDQGLRQFQIADEILLSKHNLTRLLDRMDAQGLIKRRPCREDGRGNQVTITRKGQTLMAKMSPVYGDSVRELFGSKLDTREIGQLSGILTKLRLSL